MSDRVVEVFDKALAAIAEKKNLNAEETEEIMTTLVDEVLSLGAEETGADINAFFQEWYNRHWALREMTDRGGEEAPAPTHREEVLRHLKSHYQDIAAADEIFKWLAESAPKNIPPTIICYALTMYAGGIYGFYTCVADHLYGGELPDHDHNDGGVEDIGGES